MTLGDLLFRVRGYTPLPFVVAALAGATLNPVLISAGALLMIAGECLRIQAVRHAGGATRTRQVGAPKLVTSGPYGHVRNPLYVANMLIYAGFSLASGAWFPLFPLATLAFFAFQYGMIIALEEQTLIKLFGETYEQYRRRVPRLIPKISGEGSPGATLPLSAAVIGERSTLAGMALASAMLTLRFFLLQP